MNIASSILIAGGMIVACVFLLRLCVKQGKAHVAEQSRKERQALELHPTYRQKLAEDRQYELAKRAQTFQETRWLAEFEHKRHLERTRVSPEQYLIDHEPTSIISLPSLKRAQPEERTTVTAEDEEWSLPGACTFSDVLRDFTPSAKQIYLAELAGSKLIAPGVTDLCHVANAGATGGGKSVGIRLIAAQLCYVGVRVVILNPHYTSYDMKSGEDWTPIENKLYKPPVRDFPGIKNWLKWAAEVELRRRLDRFAASQSWGVPLFIVVDELPSITKHIPDAMGWMADILREGRKVDLFLVTAAQDMLCKTLGNSGGAIRDCFRTAIYVGGDATTARVLLDVKGTVDDGGLGKGVVMLRSSQCKQAALARVPYVDNEALYHLLGPSTFDHSTIIDADPATEELAPMEDLPSQSVLPVMKEERKEVTLADAISAWNDGYTSVRTMAAHLGVTRYQAEQFCKQIAGMNKAVSD